MILDCSVKVLVQKCTLHESKCTSELFLKFNFLCFWKKESVNKWPYLRDNWMLVRYDLFPGFPFPWRSNLPLQCCLIFLLCFIPSSLPVCVIQNTALALWRYFFFSFYIYIYIYLSLCVFSGLEQCCCIFACLSFQTLELVLVPCDNGIHRTGILL